MDQDRSAEQAGYHRPVLVDEVVELMAPVVPGVVVDATFGGGGHTRRMLDEFVDDMNLENLNVTLAEGRVTWSVGLDHHERGG